MVYSIADAAAAVGLPASTLRYYDKEGLLPNVERLSGGSRVFTEDDLAWIRIIECLKKAGLTIKGIRRYTDLVQQGDSTLPDRRDLIYERRAAVEEELARVQRTLDFITYKCWFYDEAVRLGGEEAVHDLPDSEVPPDILALRRRILDGDQQPPSKAR